jgi:MoxR-like ATPase
MIAKENQSENGTMPTSTTRKTKQDSSTAPSSTTSTTYTPRVLLEQLRKEVNQWVYEREEVVDGMLVALLARKHIVQVGPPGCAKSFVVDLIASAFTGLNYFPILLHEATPPEELLGGISLMDWKDKNILKRNIEGRLPWAHLVNMEEMFNGPPPLFHTIHRIANERKFSNPEEIDCPLISIIGSSNKLPERGASEAFFDRIHLRYLIDYLQDSAAKKKLMTTRNIRPTIKVRLTLQDLEAMHQEVDQVDFPEIIADALLNLENKLLEELNIKISDRRRNDIVDILRGYAYLCGDNIISEEHLTIVPYCLWSKPEQLPNINAIVSAIGSPVTAKASEIMDSASTVVKEIGQCPSDDTEAAKWQVKASGATKQLNNMISELKSLLAENPQASESSVKKVNSSIKRIEKFREEIFDKIKAFLQIQS